MVVCRRCREDSAIAKQRSMGVPAVSLRHRRRASSTKCTSFVTQDETKCSPREARRRIAVKAENSDIPGDRSLERQLSFAMDVTYVTEKIIVVTFPEGGLDTTYRSNLKEVTRMLRTKHGNKYTVFNLSEKRHDLARLNSQIAEFGWPAHLSPPLERLCTICKSLDSWFHADSQNVAILHSKASTLCTIRP
ncbi:hypothetical protein HPB51_014658 [Rhipicephalus microplus]|uniref:Phosphatase tensin-type domain-containing protein n=1 Tax=Rhipicephalus microplus TaxID=6941 RepID=A0A9J6F478_RHIMP|nr:hypothetical protein HPB51_014658 [Rhipicephalus microplus]